MSKPIKVEEPGSRKLSDEVKTLTGATFLDRLRNGVIKEEKLTAEIAGAQSSFILLTDSSTKESYIIILPKVPPAFLNLKASVMLRNYLYEPEYSHPNLIEFVPFKENVFIEELAKHNKTANKWSGDWDFDNLCDYLAAGGEVHKDKENELETVQYAALFYDIACAKKASGASLMKIFADAKDSTECQKLLQPSAQLIFQKVVAAALHIHALQHNHTDISLGNILFDQETKHVKLVDINAARPYDEKGMVIFSKKGNAGAEGTPLCIPPEVLTRDLKEDVAVAAAGMDAFSLGVIFYQLLAGKQDVNIFNVDEKEFKKDLIGSLSTHYKELMKQSDEEIYTQIKSSMKKDGIEVGAATQDLLCKLLHPNPEKRLPIHQIYAHPYFAKQTAQTAPEVERAYQIAVKTGNKYIAAALEKTYPPIFIEKILREQVLPYLESLANSESRSQMLIFGRNAFPVAVKNDNSKVKSRITTIKNYLQPDKPRNEDWMQEIAGIIASAGQAESGRLAGPTQLKMQEFSQLIAPLVPQKSPPSTPGLS